MTPSLKRLWIQSEAEAHLLPGYHRGKILFMEELKKALKETQQEVLIETHDTL